MKLLLLPLALLATFSPALARLGETEGQSQLRYGQARDDLAGPNDQPLLPGALERMYGYQGWRVRAAFVGGVCVRIEYVHLPEDGLLPRQIADAELAAILEAEKGKFSWREDRATKQVGAAGDIERALKGAFKVRQWTRSDHATAELVLGLVLKFSSRDAESIERKLAKTLKSAPKPAGAAPGVPKF